jgi:hypothetical protein
VRRRAMEAGPISDILDPTTHAETVIEQSKVLYGRLRPEPGGRLPWLTLKKWSNLRYLKR